MTEHCLSGRISEHERNSNSENPVSSLSNLGITSTRVIHNANSNLERPVLETCSLIQIRPKLNTVRGNLLKSWTLFIDKILGVRKKKNTTYTAYTFNTPPILC